MSKDASTKTTAMREQRERLWAEQQTRAKERARQPRIDDTAVGSLDNEPSTRSLHARAKTATPAKASGAKERLATRAPAADESSSSAATAEAPAEPRAHFPNMPSRVPDADEARCDGCGKIRAVRNGKIAHHQRGLGKPCPGAGRTVA